MTQEAQAEGIDQLFLSDPLLFSQKLLEGRIKQFHAAAERDADFILYDRGIPDVLAYMDYADQSYPPEFIEACKNYHYDRVFMLPPWKEIHEVDKERYENFKQATQLHEALLNTYKSFNYEPVMLPKSSVEERCTFVENLLRS